MLIGYSPTAIIVYTFWSPHTLGMLKEIVNNRIKYGTKDQSWCIFVQSCDNGTADVSFQDYIHPTHNLTLEDHSISSIGEMNQQRDE